MSGVEAFNLALDVLMLLLLAAIHAPSVAPGSYASAP